MSSRRLGVVIGILAPLLFVTCRGDQSTLAPASDASRDVATLWWVMFAVSTVVVAAVTMLVLVAVLRRRGDLARRRWLGRGGSRLIVVGGVAVPMVILVVLFVLTLATLPSVSAPDRGAADLVVEVTGRQYWWEVRYPEHGVVTANEIHIPTGVPVEIRARAGDVIHSLWVPRLNRKIDMIPGRENRILLQADRAGLYRGQCAEFCGLAHAQMALLIVAEPPPKFQAWLAREGADAGVEDTGSEAMGREVFLTSSCVSCHAIRGTPATATIGPDLTHLAARRWLAAGTIPNSRGNLGGWLVDPQSLKPGAAMPPTNLSGPELQSLLDYLESLD